MKVSAIIPAYNEESVIEECIKSLLAQMYKPLEIIFIDDGSTDRTTEIISKYPVVLLKQNHLGPAKARNFGAKESTGKILVFVDADMVFEKDFISKLVEPIIKDKVTGTFSKDEFVLNKDNVWSKCWNINKGLPTDRMHPSNYPDHQLVFRAIQREKFEKVKGFSAIGYIDDYTLSEKLGEKAVSAPGAIYYHRNPDSLGEVFRQARWIGKSEFKRRKIKNENLMKAIALIRYSLPISLIKGLKGSIFSGLPGFLIFKLVYDLAIEISLIKSFFNEQQYK